MWKWIGYPLTSVGDQSSSKLTPTLFAGLPYARNRSLEYDLSCGGSSARLPSTSYAHKINSRPGIIIYAASHMIYNSKFSYNKRLYSIEEEILGTILYDSTKITKNNKTNKPKTTTKITKNKKKKNHQKTPIPKQNKNKNKVKQKKKHARRNVCAREMKTSLFYWFIEWCHLVLYHCDWLKTTSCMFTNGKRCLFFRGFSRTDKNVFDLKKWFMFVSFPLSQWQLIMSPSLETYTPICIYVWPWCNGYHRRKETQRNVFKSSRRLIAFHMRVNTFWKGMNPIILHLRTNCRANCLFFKPWFGNQSRRKTLNSNLFDSA